MTRNAASSAARKPLPYKDPAAPKREPAAKLAGKDAAPVASRVHDLQDLLLRRLDDRDGGRAEGKWSGRATVGFILLTCGGFWAAVALGVRLLVR